MQVIETSLAGVLILEPRVFADDRGFFLETYRREQFVELGIDVEFIQDNRARSAKNILRGLHYQLQHPQGKLCHVTRGEVFDVAVDVRRNSPNFGKWTGVVLSEKNHRMLYVPPGFAHGYCTLTDDVDFLYKCTDRYFPEGERSIIWNDPQIGIEWPVDSPLVSDKDRQAPLLADAECYEDDAYLRR